MNILIVVRCFPPDTGGGRSYRISKIVKYLCNAGHTVAVLCTDERMDPDESMLQHIDMNRLKIIRLSFHQSLLQWTFKKMIKQISIADGDLHLAYSLLDRLMKVGTSMVPDVVFTSSAPYEVHLIGMYLSSRYGMKWVADFRDPYTLNYYYQTLSPIKRYLDSRFEREIYKKADGVVFNTRQNLLDAEAKFRISEYDTGFTVTQNGYDADDLIEVGSRETGLLTISYIGGVRADKQERYFIDQVCKHHEFLESKSVRVRFVGNGSEAFLEQASRYSNVLEIIGFCEQIALKRHWEESDWLIIFLPECKNRLGWVPQKLYSYMSLRKPILAFVPEGEAREYLEKYSGALLFEPNSYQLDEVVEAIAGASIDIDNEYVCEFEQTRLFENLVSWIEEEIISNNE